MRIYYAHCIAIYHTPQEHRDIELIESVFPGATVINPSSRAIADECEAVRRDVASFNQYRLAGPPQDPSHEVMERVFQPLAKTCDVLVFRALPDGMIPAGVYKEITWAVEAGVPILELPSATSRREMSTTQTRQYLKEIGQR
jgi:hypothetical protein